MQRLSLHPFFGILHCILSMGTPLPFLVQNLRTKEFRSGPRWRRIRGGMGLRDVSGVFGDGCLSRGDGQEFRRFN